MSQSRKRGRRLSAKRKPVRGFIFLEVIVAMTLLALILTPLAGMVFTITSRSHQIIGGAYRNGVLMESVAPNVAFVVGPVLGARLIAISGGLTRLATWPAGTVQLLGAETALFRHLKEGTAPPKHGILFQHPDVHKAPPWQRGPTARVTPQRNA